MAREEPRAYRVMFANLSLTDVEREVAARLCFDSLVRSFVDGQRAELVRGDMPAIAVASANWSALHGLSMLLLDRRFDEDGPTGGAKTLLPAVTTVLRDAWSKLP